MEDKEESMKVLTDKFVELKNDVSNSRTENALEMYEKSVPDLVVMDFSPHYRESHEISKRILEFDHTACIFALIEHYDKMISDELYRSGIRVVIPFEQAINKNTVDTLMNKIYTSCNDLEHEKCVGCWLTNRFEDLEPMA